MPIGKDPSSSSAAFSSCSTYSGLNQNLVQYECLPANPSENSLSSTGSTSTSLLQQTSVIWKSQETEADTYTKQHIKDARTPAGGDDKGPQKIEKRTPIRAKRKKRSKKQEMDFAKRMLKTKRQKALIHEYKSQHALLMKLVKQQQSAPMKTKKDRLRRQHLIRKIRTLFALQRKMLRKRDRLERILMRKRLYRERQRRRHEKLKKILRVVYFKRKQRIRNMRDLRSHESNRLADNLMLEAAKLRARANRLTGGREVKHNQRKVKKTSKILEKVKETECVVPENVEAAVGVNANENSKIHIKTSMQQVEESGVKTLKKKPTKKRKPKRIDKHVKRTKNLDSKLNGLNMLMEGLLSRLSKIGKQKKHKNGKRKSRPAWWRRDRLRAAKIKTL